MPIKKSDNLSKKQYYYTNLTRSTKETLDTKTRGSYLERLLYTYIRPL